MKVVVLVVALLVAVCSAQLTSTDISTILSLHNNARANAVPVPQTPLGNLVWSTTIAADAQSWVNQCQKNYSPKYYGTVYGENPIIISPKDIPGAFNSWMSQKNYYNFADASCSTTSCANFQQIVSKTATEIGCGIATCNFGTGNTNFFVCNYKAFSQYTGVLPYTPAAGQTPKPTPAPTPAPTVKPGTVDNIDYRGTKAVLGVHDQKQCGSCWAFSSTAIIEGALGKRGLTLPLLSDQNVLDCSGGGSCNGGWTVTALRGMITKAGINSQADYPYNAAQGTCVYNSAKNQGAITKNGQTKGDFTSIYNALVAYGPVGIAVYADNAWQSYRSGVLSADTTDINHAVTIVGYNKTLDAWIVKNSWGNSWGMSGYCYLSAAHPYSAQQNGAFWAQ